MLPHPPDHFNKHTGVKGIKGSHNAASYGPSLHHLAAFINSIIVTYYISMTDKVHAKLRSRTPPLNGENSQDLPSASSTCHFRTEEPQKLKPSHQTNYRDDNNIVDSNYWNSGRVIRPCISPILGRLTAHTTDNLYPFTSYFKDQEPQKTMKSLAAKVITEITIINLDNNYWNFRLQYRPCIVPIPGWSTASTSTRKHTAFDHIYPSLMSYVLKHCNVTHLLDALHSFWHM